jgi:hypothetical protein
MPRHNITTLTAESTLPPNQAHPLALAHRESLLSVEQPKVALWSFFLTLQRRGVCCNRGGLFSHTRQHLYPKLESPLASQVQLFFEYNC